MSQSLSARVSRSGELLGDRIRLADSFLSRLFGLLGYSELPENCGLLIAGCNQVHMFGMRFPIDILFLTNDGTVVDFISNLRPWRYSKRISKADKVLELPAGTLQTRDVRLGDQILLE